VSAQLQLTDAEWLAIEREACSRSLSAFVRLAWHVVEPSQKYVHGWHIDFICEHLEAVTRGEINRLLINVPPGTMKSLLVSVFWPAWEWGAKEMPATRYVSASHSQDFAIRDTLKMRRLVSSDWYQERWKVPMTKDQNEKTKFENEATGFRQAMAMSSLTGTRGDRVIIDDPHSIEGAISNAERVRTLRVMRETVPSRLTNPDKSAIVVVMQRIHDEDVSGMLLSEDHGYMHVMLPMEFEPARRCVTAFGSDPRTDDGDLLFPARFPQEVIDRDKKMMGSYAVAGQFQQRPSPRGGGIIRGEWFGSYSIEIIQPSEIVLFADTAQKTGERNDYSVVQAWGKHEGRIYLLDQIRGKWEAPELLRRVRDFWGKWSERGAKKIMVEDKSSGTGLIQQLKTQHRVPVFGIKRVTDKLTRVQDALPHIECGNVMLPSGAPWVSDFIAECEAFTANNSHAHDDQIDPMCDAIKELLQSVRVFEPSTAFASLTTGTSA
jgi:predicted phage terminase large subunit-like protein